MNNQFFTQQSERELQNIISNAQDKLNQLHTQQRMQPIQNIINTNSQNIEFEAKFLNENEEVENIPVTRRTAFISPKNGYLKIKELNGDITTYELIVPKDEKDLKIEGLEKTIKEMEAKINELTNINGTVDEVKESPNNGKQSGKK